MGNDLVYLNVVTRETALCDRLTDEIYRNLSTENSEIRELAKQLAYQFTEIDTWDHLYDFLREIKLYKCRSLRVVSLRIRLKITIDES